MRGGVRLVITMIGYNIFSVCVCFLCNFCKIISSPWGWPVFLHHGLDWKRCPVEYFISELKCYSNSLCFTRFLARKLHSIFSVRILFVFSLFFSVCIFISLSHSFSYCSHYRTRHYCVIAIYIPVTRVFCRCRYYQFSWTASEMGCFHISSQCVAIILSHVFEKSVNIWYHCYTRKVCCYIFRRMRVFLWVCLSVTIRLVFFILFHLYYFASAV